MKIERKRYVVMRKNRTEIWGGLAQHYRFRSIDDIGDFAIKTYRTEKQAHTCSSWERNFEVVPIVETITDEEGYRKQSEWISVDERLPEDKQICLAYGTVYYVPDETESKEMLITAFYKEFGFVEQIHAHITHWMPLPEPPKMKGGAE